MHLMARSQAVICLVVGLILVGCLAEPAERITVNHQFVVHDIQVWSPQAMAVDAAGYLWFANAFAVDSVLKLNHKGNHIASVRTTPASKIATIAIGGEDGLLYLADNTQRRIVLVTTENEQITSFPYTIPIHLNIKHLTVDARGTIYIIDDASDTAEVWKMSSDGSSLPSITSDPPIKPACMALDLNNVLYVADRQTSQIYQYSRHGDQIGIFSSPLVRYVIGLAIDGMFNLYLSELGYSDKGTITKLSPDGVVLGSYQQLASLMAVDAQGSIYITDFSGDITKLSGDLLLVDEYHTDAPLSVTAGVMPDPDGGLITINDRDKTLMRLHSNGTVKSRSALDLDEFVVGYAGLGSDNYVYLYGIDGVNGTIMKLSSNGTILTSTVFADLGVDSFSIGSEGNIYVSNTDDCNCVIVYSPNGQELRRILPGVDPAKMFTWPNAIYVHSNSSLYVLDYMQGMLYQLSPTDQLLWSFNFSGYTAYPISFTIDIRGDVYVTDVYGNHFIHILRNMGDLVVDYHFDDLTLIAPRCVIGADSTIYLSDYMSRIIILTPRPPHDMSSTDRTLMIVFATVGSLALLVTVGAVLFQHVCIKQLDEPEIEGDTCKDTSQHHASRRGRSCRRGAGVNFLHNYHDNLRFPTAEEDSADVVLYI